MVYVNTELKTIAKRVESEEYYVTLDMFVADARRMFNNCRTYNSPDTIYYKCATSQVTRLLYFLNYVLLILYN
ncbi:hypothetical protein YC2023_025529 [Brassica napus]|uniref:(rape) hypothetical protein n=1 Tax=Brassica napus TaxID=3708 RepID=A0A816X906_BRANA|nr:unnamed protein product [Brassica napus]